jgi:peptide/nickel transport system permease protein
LGLRVSLTIGGVAVLISVVLGVFVGSIAGYWGGKLDDFISFIINILWAIPTLLWVFVLLIILGKGYWQLFTAIGLTMWIEVARLVRGEVMRIKVLPYIEAAKSFGLSDGRILWRHILPNVAGSVAVVAASNFASAVLIESGLSYLGLGIQPPTPSWGNMLSENYGLLLSDTPYPALFPALFIAILVLFLNIIGAAMRDAFAVQ